MIYSINLNISLHFNWIQLINQKNLWSLTDTVTSVGRVLNLFALGPLTTTLTLIWPFDPRFSTRANWKLIIGWLNRFLNELKLEIKINR